MLKAHQISQYLLEVIKTNTNAYDLYKKAGFKVTRGFDYFVAPRSEIEIPRLDLLEGYRIRETMNPDWRHYQTFWDFTPSWQNSIDSIKRKSDHFTIFEVMKGNEVTGYGIVEDHTGDIPQLTIAPSCRQQNLGSILLSQLIHHTSSDELKIINTDAAYPPFKKLMQRFNLKPGYGQYEMMLKL